VGLNRYYYQSRIPSRTRPSSRAAKTLFRLAWRKRILDHDGDGTKPGGIEKWLRLVELPASPANTRSAAMAFFGDAFRSPSLRRFRIHSLASRSRRFFP